MNTFKNWWRWWPVLALLGGLTGFLGLVVYVGLVQGEGDNSTAAIAPWAAAMAVGALLAWVAPAVGTTRVARPMLLGSTAILGGIGAISALGIILVPAAILTGLAVCGASPTLTVEDAHF